jgi:hypothetical protein
MYTNWIYTNVLVMAMAMPTALVMAMVMVIAMAMMIMISLQRPPSIMPSPDEGYTIIRDLAKIKASNTDDELHLVYATSVRYTGCMLDISVVEIWRYC